MMIIAITGTNTDVGKTIATAALAAELSHRGHHVDIIKPIQTGEAEGAGDIYTIEQLTGIKGHELIRYPEPLAPNLAARRAAMPMLTAHEVAQRIGEFHDRAVAQHAGTAKLPPVVLVEGAGGLLVRINEQENFADVVRLLGCGLIVVTSLGLGSLNAAELTVEAANARGIDVFGIIGGSISSKPDLATTLNLEELPRITKRPFFGALPEGLGGNADSHEYDSHASQARLRGHVDLAELFAHIDKESTD
ncbi:MAG: dethiobiotin synthase [Corynebacterium sp.]|uniref:dethiobiotin synthase n=1 Tax=Corynebacterium sp. TaxID=1720 RepID=UPI0026DAA66E|nr:dethiobiotin synthase [Corynebacterium sp.]MDO4761891.1 dethiobiotin synthase [Corynebacterium sp.]